MLAGGIIVALLVMLGGIIWIWNSATPQQASASSPALAVPTAAAVTASLDSARKYMGQSQWSKAEAILIQATAKYPEDQELRIARAETLVGLKRYSDAYTQYEKALAIGPRESKTEFAAGVAAANSNQVDRAIEHFSMAQTQEPRNATYPFWLAQMQRKAGSIEACKASLLRAANLDPENANVWGTLADIALGENNVNLALQHVNKARQLQPQVSEWRVVEARAHKRKGEPDKALMVLNAIEPMQRKDAPVARLMAECYGMLGRPADAASVMGDASLAAPTDGALAYDAAAAYERAGNKAKAVEFAKYAKALGNASAVKLLEKLGQ
jgi:Flp pilus assembly protein TadD